MGVVVGVFVVAEPVVAVGLLEDAFFVFDVGDGGCSAGVALAAVFVGEGGLPGVVAGGVLVVDAGGAVEVS